MVQTLEMTWQESCKKQVVIGLVEITDPSLLLCAKSTHVTHMQSYILRTFGACLPTGSTRKKVVQKQSNFRSKTFP